VIALSGTRDDEWSPRSWPRDEKASDAIREALSGKSDGLYGIKLDFRDADLTGAYFYDCWINGADFTETVLEGIDLNAAHATDVLFQRCRMARAMLSKATLWRAKFDGADLTAAGLVRADASDASFVGAILKDADLTAGTFSRANFTSANLRGCSFGRSFLLDATLTGASVEGARGEVYGPVLVEIEPQRRVLEGAELQRWFTEGGASIEVRSLHEGRRGGQG
jgi:uncharacterized protein YjbI with pentapeptide repeats